MTIGEKRNWLIEQSRGAIIVQFDDDDYYAPRYVERMTRRAPSRSIFFPVLMHHFFPHKLRAYLEAGKR